MGQLEELLEQQRQIMRQMADIASDTRLKQEWYTVAELARLKGISHAVLTTNRWLCPLGGQGWKRIARRKRFHRSVAKQWLQQSDDELLDLYGTPSDRNRYQRMGLSFPKGTS